MLAAEIWQHTALCLCAPTNHSPLRAPRGIEGKSAGSHLLCGEFCGTERAGGFLRSPNDLLICWWQLSLLKPCVLLLSSALPAPALPRSTSRGFLSKLSTSFTAEIPVRDHKGRASRPNEQCGLLLQLTPAQSALRVHGKEDTDWGSRDLQDHCFGNGTEHSRVCFTKAFIEPCSKT